MKTTDSLRTIKTIWRSSQFFDPQEKNCRRSGLPSNWYLLYVRCPIYTAERQRPRICEQNNKKLGWNVARNEARSWKVETFSKSRISWKIQHAVGLDVRQQHENLLWRSPVYRKQEEPSSAFSHQDKPLRGYVWNCAEDRSCSSPFTEDMHSSVETEEELDQLFNAAMKNGRDKEEKEEANQQPRKDKDGNQTNETSEETKRRKTTKNYCVTCEKESSGDYKCSVCDHFVHDISGGSGKDSEGFGHNVTCNPCVRKNRINIEQEGAKSGQEQQAHKMVSLSNLRLPAVDIGTNVVVKMPDVDRGRWAPRNVRADVVDVSSFGLYQLSTKEGLLERLYAGKKFTTADRFIDAHDVPSSSLSLRSASMITSRRKQRFVSCNCKINKRCKYKV